MGSNSSKGARTLWSSICRALKILSCKSYNIKWSRTSFQRVLQSLLLWRAAFSSKSTILWWRLVKKIRNKNMHLEIKVNLKDLVQTLFLWTYWITLNANIMRREMDYISIHRRWKPTRTSKRWDRVSFYYLTASPKVKRSREKSKQRDITNMLTLIRMQDVSISTKKINMLASPWMATLRAHCGATIRRQTTSL